MLNCMLLLLKYMNMYSLTFDLPAEFLSFYGLLNFYLYTLAFVYSPSKNALYGRWCNILDRWLVNKTETKQNVCEMYPPR